MDKSTGHPHIMPTGGVRSWELFCAHVNSKGDLNPVAMYFMHYELYSLATTSVIIPLTPTWNS